MNCYEVISTILELLGFIILAVMVYSIKAKEHADAEEAKEYNG